MSDEEDVLFSSFQEAGYARAGRSWELRSEIARIMGGNYDDQAMISFLEREGQDVANFNIFTYDELSRIIAMGASLQTVRTICDFPPNSSDPRSCFAPNRDDPSSNNLLVTACQTFSGQRSLDIILYLVRKFPFFPDFYRVYESHESRSHCPLHILVGNDMESGIGQTDTRLQAMQAILDKHPQAVTFKDGNEILPLSRALLYGSCDDRILTWLLEKGPEAAGVIAPVIRMILDNRFVIRPYGPYPLHIACSERCTGKNISYNFVEDLIEAYPDAYHNSGYSPLHYLCCTDKFYELIGHTNMISMGIEDEESNRNNEHRAKRQRSLDHCDTGRLDLVHLIVEKNHSILPKKVRPRPDSTLTAVKAVDLAKKLSCEDPDSCTCNRCKIYKTLDLLDKAGNLVPSEKISDENIVTAWNAFHGDELYWPWAVEQLLMTFPVSIVKHLVGIGHSK